MIADRHKLLVVDLEPAPYKIDLWNAFAASNIFDIKVLYSTAKNWAPDGCHDFQELAFERFSSRIFYGKGIKALFRSGLTLLFLLIRWRPDFVFISGYVDALPLLAIIACIPLRIKYAVHSDIFNNNPPHSRSDYFKHFVRNLLRKLIFQTCTAMLTCGIRGRDSAIVAGCRKNKIYDFPYVVDAQRLRSDKPSYIPDVCRKDLELGKVIILFSGRLIQRKGLATLINAVAVLAHINNWVLWIEGDGPLMSDYVTMVKKLGLTSNCRFLGFCQMSLHSWLLRNSNIVIVPSLRDPWGIVVDEGMQMGKAVIASDATGSGADRISNGENGLLFPAGNHLELARALRTLLTEPEKRMALGNLAKRTAIKYGPMVNVGTISNLLHLD
jgi:glycosyltransferase involved in cell wall biosynthesis